MPRVQLGIGLGLEFFAAVTTLRLQPVVSGIVVGIVTSLPDAIITKAYAHIMVTAVIFGAIRGLERRPMAFGLT